MTTFDVRMLLPFMAGLVATLGPSDSLGHEFSVEFANGCCAVRYGGSCVARPNHPEPLCQAGHMAIGSGPTTASWTDCIGVGCVIPIGECIRDIETGAVTDPVNGLDDDCDGAPDQSYQGQVADRIVNLEWANGCCGSLYKESCDARPQHPDVRCRAGRKFYGQGAGSASWFDCIGTGCVYDTSECVADIATGAVAEVHNDRDDDCDGYIDDEQCDGQDNDGDGLVDEDVGSCLLKILFVPLCFDGTQQEFEAAVTRQMDFFMGSLSLTDCAKHINNFVMKVSDVNLPCPTGANDPICYDEVNRWYEQAKTAAAAVPGADPRNFNEIVALTNKDICGRIEGLNNNGGFIWSQPNADLVVAHELGHYFGLADEYCSVAAGGPSPCNSADSPNFLGTDLGCDPAPDGCCEHCDGYSVCCKGNQNPLGGRCIMSYANAPGPRAYCERCLAQLTTPPNPRSETNPNGEMPLACSFTHIGSKPALDMTYSVSVEGRLDIESATFTRGRTSIAGEVSRGRYVTEVLDESGTRIFRTAYDLTFGSSVVSSGVGPVAPIGVRQDRGLKIALPDAIAPSSRLRVNLFRDGEKTAQATLNGAAPTVDVGPDRQVECSSPLGALVALSAKVYDPDGDIVSVDWSAPGVGLSADSGQGVTGQFPMGESVVEAHATDGLLEQSDRVSVTVVDMTPPSFTSVVATPACLWPPKHKYVAFELGKNVLAQVSDH